VRLPVLQLFHAQQQKFCRRESVVIALCILLQAGLAAGTAAGQLDQLGWVDLCPPGQSVTRLLQEEHAYSISEFRLSEALQLPF
jgi:hypothetical protein